MWPTLFRSLSCHDTHSPSQLETCETSLGPSLITKMSKLVEYAASAAAEFKYLWFY